MHLITRFELLSATPCKIANGDVRVEVKVL